MTKSLLNLKWHYKLRHIIANLNKETKMSIMQKTEIDDFSQVKKYQLAESVFDNLLADFKVETLLKRAKITKNKGLPTIYIILCFFHTIIKQAKSVREGLSFLDKPHHQNAINDFLNCPNYNWRKLQLYVAKLYSVLFPTENGKPSLFIVDDTSVEKTGKKVEYIAKFKDHVNNVKFNGYQFFVGVWSNYRTSIPIDFVLKVGDNVCPSSKRGKYDKASHIRKRLTEAKKEKTKSLIDMIKRVRKHRFKIDYILWDTWFNSTDAFKYIFNSLVPKGIHLISMFRIGDDYLTYKTEDLKTATLCKRLGTWKKLPGNKKIKYKSAVVEIKDKSIRNMKKRPVIGKFKICFFRFPGQTKKDCRAIISTNLELSEEEILEIYSHRWAIEVVIKDLRQLFGFANSQASKYAPQIADLTIRCICYVLLCSQKEYRPCKSTYAIQLFIRMDFEHKYMETMVKLMLKGTIKSFLQYALEEGITDVKELLVYFDFIYKKFFTSHFYEDKITEVDDKPITVKTKKCKRLVYK